MALASNSVLLRRIRKGKGIKGLHGVPTYREEIAKKGHLWMETSLNRL